MNFIGFFEIVLTFCFFSGSVLAAPDAVTGASFDLRNLQNSLYVEGTSDLSIPQLLSQPTSKDDFWIAVEITENNQILQESVFPLLHALQQTFPEKKVAISLIPSEQFSQEVIRKNIPFVIASAGTSITLSMQTSAIPLAAREHAYNQLSGSGALLITRSDRTDIHTLHDLADKKIAVPSTLSFGPWQWLQGRLLQEKIDPDHFFHSIEWIARETPDIFDAIDQKIVDIGLINTCVWENYVQNGLLDPHAFKAVAPMQASEDSVCLSSTAFYPNWIMSYTRFAQDDQLRRLAAVVFSLPSQNDYRWGLRVDLSSVQTLMKELKWGIYNEKSYLTFSNFFHEYKQYFSLLLVLFLFLLFHVFRSNHLVTIKTRALRKALEEKDQMATAVRQSHDQLRSLERNGMLSQMSLMFAHELKQPLSSIRNYIGGLVFLNQRPHTSHDQKIIARVLRSMTKETQRVSDIVERVRGYATAHHDPLVQTDLTPVIEQAIKLIEHHSPHKTKIHIAPTPYVSDNHAPIWVFGNRLELELLLLNLLRNATEATACQKRPLITLSVEQNNQKWILKIQDNGPKLTAERFARLTSYGDSIKKDGLGIGLSICRGITDRHGGSLFFHQNPTQGITVEIQLPVYEGEIS